jgi:carbonic anhydrase
VPVRPKTADEVLQHLKDGNERFVRGEPRFAVVCKEKLADLARAQRPYATIVGCSDSRVPPEQIFDAGLGELFIIRVAGNVVSPEVTGSPQYAEMHLETPLVVVLGHEGCGAVAAALDAIRRGMRQHSRIQRLLDNIIPGLAGIEPARTRRGAAARRGGQRPLVDRADPGHARSAGARDGGEDEAGLSGVRDRDGPRAFPPRHFGNRLSRVRDDFPENGDRPRFSVAKTQERARAREIVVCPQN